MREDGSIDSASLLPPQPRGDVLLDDLRINAVSIAIHRTLASLLRATPSLKVRNWSSRMLEVAGLDAAADGEATCFSASIQSGEEDFWYCAEEMCQLNRTSQQRNRQMRADRFAAEQSPTVVPIESDGILAACASFVNRWWEEKSAAQPMGLSLRDWRFTQRLLKHYDALRALGMPLCGLGVIVAGRLVAFTVAEYACGGQSLNIQVEKATREMYGSYQYIGRETARTLLRADTRAVFINRQNAPDPGLRRVKLALGPAESVHKWTLLWRHLRFVL